MLSILSASRIVAWEEGTVVSGWRRFLPPRVVLESSHYRVGVPSTISNSTEIQCAMLRHLANGEPITGVLIVTASAYVDVQRVLRWIGHQGDGVVVGGSSAPDFDGSRDATFLSGFCQYFSWDAIRMLSVAEGLDRSVPVDIAFSRWLNEHGITWVDPGVEWDTRALDAGNCPICLHGNVTVVRCTSHGAREKEADYMRLLDHPHIGD
jgi:hypothetical protein